MLLSIFCLDPTAADARKQGLSAMQNRQSDSNGSDVSLKRQINKWISLVVLELFASQAQTTCQALAFGTHAGALWLQTPIRAHPDRDFIYNAWCINSLRPCWETEEPSSPRSGGRTQAALEGGSPPQSKICWVSTIFSSSIASGQSFNQEQKLYVLSFSMKGCERLKQTIYYLSLVWMNYPSII